MNAHSWIEQYIGLPYVQGGDTPTGFNCWGFFRHVQKRQFGIHVPEIPEPEEFPKLLRKVPAAAAALGWEKVIAPVTGDAALMTSSKHPSHCGVIVIVGGIEHVLHCISGPGVVFHSPRHLEVGGWQILARYRPVATSTAKLEVPGHE